MQFTDPAITGSTSIDGTILGIALGGEFQIRQRELASISFHTSDNEKMRIAASGKVGIGTTNPSVALEVSGTISATNILIGGVALTSQTDRIISGTATVIVNANTSVSVSVSMDVSGDLVVAGTVRVARNGTEICEESTLGTIRFSASTGEFEVCK